MMASEAADAAFELEAFVKWECGDWLLPNTFSASGTPIEIVQTIAKAIGAVVRAEDDGAILVRRKYPIRPFFFAGEEAITYDRYSNLIELSMDDEKGGGYSSIQVYGYSTTPSSVTLEQETPSPAPGDTVYLRMYWEGTVPAILDTFASAGYVVIENNGAPYYEEVTEKISVVNYSGSTQKSIHTIASHGPEVGSLTYKSGYKALTSDTEHALVDVTYTTRFMRYKLAGHMVDELLFVLLTGSEHDISVAVTMDVNDAKPAPPLKADLLTTESAALEAGTAWLDDNRYDSKNISLSAPYLDEAIDGALVFLDDGELGVTGSGHVLSVSIEFEGPKVSNKLEVKNCLV